MYICITDPSKRRELHKCTCWRVKAFTSTTTNTRYAVNKYCGVAVVRLLVTVDLISTNHHTMVNYQNLFSCNTLVPLLWYE